MALSTHRLRFAAVVTGRSLRAGTALTVAAMAATACYTPAPMPLYAHAERLSNGPAFEAQRTRNDCGIASAAILLRMQHRAISYTDLVRSLGSYHDDPLTLAQLRDLLAVNGLPTRGVHLSEGDLSKLQSPMIAWLAPGHYVVVEPNPSGDVVVTDPAAGRWVIPKARWVHYWTGYALIPTGALTNIVVSGVGPMQHVSLTELTLTKELRR